MAPATLNPVELTAARFARAEIGVGDIDPLRDILALIDGQTDLPVALLPLPDGVAGAYGKKEGRTFAFVNSKHHPVRRRFTLAHEFGHHRLGHVTVVDRDEDVFGKPRRAEERRANSFAAEFLVPQQGVDAWMEARGRPPVDLEIVVRLAEWYGVSAQVALYRLDAARFISSQAARAQLEQMIQAGAHLDLARFLRLSELEDASSFKHVPLGGQRMPQRMAENVVRSYQAGLVPIERAAAALREEPAVLARRFHEQGISPTEDDDPDY